MIRNRGFTLIELMVSLLLGLIVLGGVMGVFVSTYQANSQNIKAIRLNEEMRAIVGLMSRDVRRAGIRGFTWNVTSVNWYSTYQFGTTGTNWVISRYNGAAPANSCALFSYDSDGDDVVDNEDQFGYRLNPINGAVEAYRFVSAGQWKCDGTGTNWTAITDPKLLWVQSLSFTATTEPGLAGIIVRTVVVNMRAATNTRSTTPSQNITAADCNNPSKVDIVCRQVQEKIRVRNDPLI